MFLVPTNYYHASAHYYFHSQISFVSGKPVVLFVIYVIADHDGTVLFCLLFHIAATRINESRHVPLLQKVALHVAG